MMICKNISPSKYVVVVSCYPAKTAARWQMRAWLEEEPLITPSEWWRANPSWSRARPTTWPDRDWYFVLLLSSECCFHLDLFHQLMIGESVPALPTAALVSHSHSIRVCGTSVLQGWEISLQLAESSSVIWRLRKMLFKRPGELKESFPSI